jgi:hypothetical protein
MIIGRSADASSFAAAAISAGSGGTGAGIAAEGRGKTSPRDAIMSQHISTTTGPGRPESIRRNASSITAGASDGRSILAVHFTSGRSAPSWSESSCRWPRPRPRKALGTWPVMHSTGALQPMAVQSAAAVFRTPGPGTTEKTPGRPVERA